MTPRLELVSRHFQLGLLRGASLLVPGRQRAEWRQEWHSELWHVRRAQAPMGTGSWQAERAITSFCLGAFQDALCLRQNWWQKEAFATWQGSAGQCILRLAAALAASYAIGLLLPGVRAESHPSRYQVNPGLILIQDARYNNDSAATIPFERFQILKGRRQRYFDDFAFYRTSQETVSIEAGAKAGWKVAHASLNLFALLGLPIRFKRPAGEVDGHLPKVILSDEAWKREFGGNPHIAGSVMRVGPQRARIVGVAPDGGWRLPGKADAWLLEADSGLAADGAGYVVAHLTRLGQSEMCIPRVQITSYNSHDSEDDLCGVSFEERTRGPWGIFLFSVLLALLALPAATSMSMGEYSIGSHRRPWSSRLRLWGFLSVKIVLLLSIVYFLSLDLAYCHTTTYSSAAEYMQLVSSFSICLFGLRWALFDQRQRCPVCLRRVTHPAHVGQVSKTFLAWNGTELICSGGHALLHIPGLPTSWFSTQRWLYLDSSWESLFAGSSEG